MVEKPKLIPIFGAALLFVGAVFITPGYAAYGQDLLGLHANQAEMTRQLRDAKDTIKEYASSHDHFPNGTQEIDEVLKLLHKRVTMKDADSTVQVQQSGKWRTFYQFAGAVDDTYKGIPEVNGVAKIPDYFVAPPNMIVFMSDGTGHCAGYVSGADGKPYLVDGSPIYFEQTIPQKQAGSK